MRREETRATSKHPVAGSWTNAKGWKKGSWAPLQSHQKLQSYPRSRTGAGKPQECSGHLVSEGSYKPCALARHMWISFHHDLCGGWVQSRQPKVHQHLHHLFPLLGFPRLPLLQPHLQRRKLQHQGFLAELSSVFSFSWRSKSLKSRSGHLLGALCASKTHVLL